MKKTIYIFLFILFHSFSGLFADDISVFLKRRTVGVDQSFTIEFSSDIRVNGKPDFSPLQKDFEIVSTSKSNNTSIINGEISQKINWVLELMPKYEGHLVIPSIFFGKTFTQPTSIEVTAAHTTERDDSIFLEAELTPKTAVYAQTQLIYTVRLYRSVNLAQATLSEVKVTDQDAIIEKLGNDVEYEHHNNKNRYIVIERKYAIYPQHEGELIVFPTVFEGSIMTGGNSFFNVKTQYKRVYSNQVTTEVKPIPPPFQKDNWLAAYDVKLNEEWSADPASLTMGEPITWTLTLVAEGCLGSQLPAIPLQLPEDIKQYQDKPLIENKVSMDGNIGIRQTKIALIASKNGTIQIPEVTIQWWDLKEDKIRETLLPARIIHVQGGHEVAMNNQIDQTINGTEKNFHQQNTIGHNSLPLWAWGLIGLNSIWIIGLGYFIVKKIDFKRFAKPNALTSIKSAIKEACQKNDAKKAEVNLLSWATLTYPSEKFRTIMDIKRFVTEDLQESITELYQSLYGNRTEWKGESLLKSFVSFKKKKRSDPIKNSEDKFLKKLYPND